jgi:hypothetical protein
LVVTSFKTLILTRDKSTVVDASAPAPLLDGGWELEATYTHVGDPRLRVQTVQLVIDFDDCVTAPCGNGMSSLLQERFNYQHDRP